MAALSCALSLSMSGLEFGSLSEAAIAPPVLGFRRVVEDSLTWQSMPSLSSSWASCAGAEGAVAAFSERESLRPFAKAFFMKPLDFESMAFCFRATLASSFSTSAAMASSKSLACNKSCRASSQRLNSAKHWPRRKRAFTQCLSISSKTSVNFRSAVSHLPCRVRTRPQFSSKGFWHSRMRVFVATAFWSFLPGIVSSASIMSKSEEPRS
mmetsp:Transcript_14125/g.29579  ORF Transcript_14125/g.29579 Transcript_14125/m.29579 type:complete len:210 (+) Transcript_14125:161-790(+)